MKNIRKNAFTLVEVLVAVAVLVIMMTFIFQYTASAQRLWAANTARTEMSAQADTLFSLLEQDLTHMYVVQKDEEIDAQAGWYCKTLGGDFEDFCLFTEDPDPESTGANAHATVYPVRYHFEPGTPGDIYKEGRGKLYRYVEEKRRWDKVAEKFGDNARGMDLTWYYDDTDTPADQEDFLLVSNIQSLKIFSDAAYDDDAPWFDASDTIWNGKDPWLFRKKPSWFRVEVTLSVPENLRNGATADENTDRTFSRVFQMDR